jgi:hypothetical protein
LAKARVMMQDVKAGGAGREDYVGNGASTSEEITDSKAVSAI